MSLVVSDTSPLNLLIQVGQVEVLPSLFGRVVIPPAVASELPHSKAPEKSRMFITDAPKWLQIQSPAGVLSIPELDPGEAAAISLALELESALLIDERVGRRKAQSLGLRVVGAIGILEIAANISIISDLKVVHDAIRMLPFRVSEAILKTSLERHLEAIQKKKEISPNPGTSS